MFQFLEEEFLIVMLRTDIFDPPTTLAVWGKLLA